jgi:hypothetical protein
MLRYILNVWNAHTKNGRPPPVVLPVVLYHGRKKWRKRRLIEYLSIVVGTQKKLFIPYVPEFEYILVNLNAYEHSEIEQALFKRTEVKIWLLLQKYIYHADRLLQYLNSILTIDILYYHRESGLRFLRTTLLYIALSSGLKRKDMAKAIKNTDPLIREEYMTLAEQHIQEGIKKGIAQGTLLDKQHVLIKMLSKKFGLKEDEKSYIRSIEDPDRLEKAIDEFVFADTKEQVLAALKAPYEGVAEDRPGRPGGA